MMMMMMMMILGPFLIGCCYFEVPLDIFQVGQRISLLLQHKVWWLLWAQGKGLWLVDTYSRAGGVNLLFVFRSDSPGHSVQGKGKSSKGKGTSKSKSCGYEVCSSSGGGEGCCDGHLLVCFFFCSPDIGEGDLERAMEVTKTREVELLACAVGGPKVVHCNIHIIYIT